MVFCPTCGAEIGDHEKFCKYCGSEIVSGVVGQPSPSQTIPPSSTSSSAPTKLSGGTQYSGKKSAKKVGKVVLVLLIILSGSFGILVAATWGEYNQQVPFSIAASGMDYDNITLNIGATTAEINIDYIDPYDGAPLANGSYEQHLVGARIGGEYAFTYGLDGKTISLTQGGNFWWLFLAVGYARINVHLLKNTTYTFVLATEIGSINVNIPAGTGIIKGISARASTGNVLLSATSREVIGNVNVATSTGSVTTTFAGMNVTGSVVGETSTGSNSLTLSSCNVTGNVRSTTSTGNLGVSLTNNHVGGNFEFSTSTGNIVVSCNNLTIDNDNPQFSVSASTGNMDIDFLQGIELGGTMGTSLVTSTGNIDLTYQGRSGLNTGFKAIGSTSTGNVELHPQGSYSTGAGNTLQTNNYDTTAIWKINALTVQTSTGNVHLYASLLS